MIFVSLLLALFAASGDEGVGLDPFGRLSAQGDYTACIDPNGGCRERALTSFGDEGTGIDPHGGPSVRALSGGGMDPNG